MPEGPKCGENKDRLIIRNVRTSVSVKQDGTNAMTWACVAPSGTDSLFFIHDVTQGLQQKLIQKSTEPLCRSNLQRNTTNRTGRNMEGF